MSEFQIGEKAVYPGHGVAEVTGLEKRKISDSSMEFYVLRVLENSMKVMVPKHNADKVGLRRLVGEEEIQKVYEVLHRRDEKISTATWNRRYRAYSEKLRSGSVEELAQVTRDLYRLQADKELSFGERQMLEQARSLLIKELSLATKREESEIAQEIEAVFAT